MTTIRLPWPSPILSPNGRAHWAKKAKAVKAAREAAHWLTWNHVGRNMGWQGVQLSVTFCPPDRRRRDDDNATGAFKAYRDGIADALGIDDHKFKPTYAWGEPVKGGAVLVEILPLNK
jgi:crossover junction endodeoxyribonuclease RusA